MSYISRGMGYTPKVGSGGQVIDCDLWSNLFEGICWQPGSTLDVKPDPSNPTGAVVPILPGSPDDHTSWTGALTWVGIALVGVFAASVLLTPGPRRYAR